MMVRNNHFVMLWMVLLSSMLVVPSVLAATHTVGGNTGWATPPSGDPYATWASQQTFAVGDVLGIYYLILSTRYQSFS